MGTGRSFLQRERQLMAQRDGRRFDGQPSLSGYNGTIMVIGRVGQICAAATREMSGAAAAHAARRNNFRRASFILPSIDGRPTGLRIADSVAYSSIANEASCLRGIRLLCATRREPLHATPARPGVLHCTQAENGVGAIDAHKIASLSPELSHQFGFLRRAYSPDRIARKERQPHTTRPVAHS